VDTGNILKLLDYINMLTKPQFMWNGIQCVRMTECASLKFYVTQPSGSSGHLMGWSLFGGVLPQCIEWFTLSEVVIQNGPEGLICEGCKQAYTALIKFIQDVHHKNCRQNQNPPQIWFVEIMKKIMYNNKVLCAICLSNLNITTSNTDRDKNKLWLISQRAFKL